MVKCAICSEYEQLPFNCSYCKGKYCRKHRLPEKHSCTGLTMERVRMRRADKKHPPKKSWISSSRQSGYERAYEVPGVFEVIKRRLRKNRANYIGLSKNSFEVSEKLIVGGIILFILLLGILSRVL